jgi:hypothetical protein
VEEKRIESMKATIMCEKVMRLRPGESTQMHLMEINDFPHNPDKKESRESEFLKWRDHIENIHGIFSTHDFATNMIYFRNNSEG